jgi:Glycogen recognition site of AMP-activated protein kinase
MSDHRLNETDSVVQRVTRALAAPERFGDDFEQTLVEAIRADRAPRKPLARRAAPLSPAWWAAPALLRVSPLASLAIAASIAAVAVLGTVQFAPRRGPQTTVARSVHDTVTFVRFVFVGQAKSVTLVGDFNRWGGETTPLTQSPSGAWTVSVPVANGRHEYAFIVNGTRWTTDPLAPTKSDDFDTKSSIITVGT